MSEKAVHIALYPSDWLAGTRGLTPAETGVYITLVCMMYERQAPLSFDTARLARMCNCPAGTFRKILDVLLDERKLIQTPEGLWQRRVEQEITAAQEAMTEATARAKRAAEARWSKVKPQSDQCENVTVKPQSDNQQQAPHTAEKSNEISSGEMQAQCASNANQNQNQNQRDKGGGGDTREAPPDRPPDPNPTFRERIIAACGADPGSGLTGPNGTVIGTRADMLAVESWRDDLGLTEGQILAVIEDAMSRKRDGPPSRLSYFNRPMQREAGRKTSPKLTPIEGETDASPARSSRQAAASDALRYQLDVAGRMRRPSSKDCF